MAHARHVKQIKARFVLIFSMHNGTYYKDKLSATNLLKCYEIATPRIKQYLDAEIQFTISNVRGAELVLELGCGYGRAMRALSPFLDDCWQ
jgi:2-polyprenyl-6-hydroxyphenyl methylase/3-demethylubiquinone-9 3-methyltransferase